jgi:hypothetical protein
MHSEQGDIEANTSDPSSTLRVVNNAILRRVRAARHVSLAVPAVIASCVCQAEQTSEDITDARQICMKSKIPSLSPPP